MQLSALMIDFSMNLYVNALAEFSQVMMSMAM
jgi:hypothetical protein